MDQPRNDPGVHPADPRVRFAAERTLLAWVRTGLTIQTLGFAVARFQLHGDLSPPAGRDVWSATASAADDAAASTMGVMLMAVGSLALLLAAVRHVAFSRSFERRQWIRLGAWIPEVVLAIALTIVGVVMMVQLL